MKKKLQIFVSSTYEDMLVERQATVEAILKAGHIPAGMELFNAGDKTQLEIIKRWIEDSDIFLLMLGGRYGTLEPKTKKSYIELEYRYARKLKKPYFTIVIKEEALIEKVNKHGGKVREQVNISKYRIFRRLALKRMSHFYKDVKDIQLSIFQNIRQYENANLPGWVSGKEVQEIEMVLRENIGLRKSNEIIQNKLDKMLQMTSSKDYEGYSYVQIKQFLKNAKITIKNIKTNVFDLFIAFSERFNIGVANSQGYSSDLDSALFNNVIPTLLNYGLAEKTSVPASVFWSRAHTSKVGYRFIAESNSKMSNYSKYQNEDLKKKIQGIFVKKEIIRKTDTTLKGGTSVPRASDCASTRIDRILSVMGIKREYLPVVSPRSSFHLYSGPQKNKCYIIVIHEYEGFDISKDLVEIRVMMEEWKRNKEEFECIIVTNETLKVEKKNKLESLFKEKSGQVKEKKFRFSIWDNSKLSYLEKKYSLR
jgi:hypothetical protein